LEVAAANKERGKGKNGKKSKKSKKASSVIDDTEPVNNDLGEKEKRELLKQYNQISQQHFGNACTPYGFRPRCSGPHGLH
jgi:hypothetical protein